MQLNYSGSGTIFFKDQEYRCDLYKNTEEGGTMVKISIPKRFAGYLELPLKFDKIAGKLSNGFQFILLKCDRCKMVNLISEERSEYSYTAEYMLNGIGKEYLDVNFSKVSYGITNIIPWGGISEYCITDECKMGYSEEKEIELYKDESMQVKYKVSGSFLPCIENDLLKEEIILRQYGSICIQFSEERPLEEYTEELMKIKRLIELSSLKRIYIEEIWGWNSQICDIYDSDSKFERPIKIDAIYINKREAEKDKIDKSDIWRFITLTELRENNSFNYYFEKYKKLEPIIELYMELFRKGEISGRRMFLNLVQALETYHSRFTTNDLEGFKWRVDNEILKDRPEEGKERERKLLMANSRKFVTLESRLADLLIAEFQIYFDTGNIKREEFPSVIARTRNYYIHYDEKIKEKGLVLNDEEITIYNKTLVFILEYYLLLELGFQDVKKLNEKLIGRWGHVSDKLRIQHAVENLERAE